jgi:hypothetical protein
MPVMALGVGADRRAVVECPQNLALGPGRGPFLLADWTVHRESKEHFSHNPLPVGLFSAIFTDR